MKQKVNVLLCDRCPIGGESRATRTVAFGLDGSSWQIDVCEKHGDDLDRQIGSWSRLGREVDSAATRQHFSGEYVDTARRLAELRSKQSAQDRAAAPPREPEPEPELPVPVLVSTRPVKMSVPHDGFPWVFTEHARARLEERGIDILDALWAATEPTTVRPGREGAQIRTRGTTKVVVDGRNGQILTVATRDELGREDGSTQTAANQ